MSVSSNGGGIEKSLRLNGVKYEIRGPVYEIARSMELAGETVCRLNIGNTAPFGYPLPVHLTDALAANIAEAAGYSDSRGIVEARRAIVNDVRSKGISIASEEDVYIGNGVSEWILMAMQALLNPGDEVLLPTPDYPLWTAATTLNGGKPVHYPCDSENGWYPLLTELEALITPRSKALVVINPNNPTGSVYPPEVLQGLAALAKKYGLLLFADEIYNGILYEDKVHHSLAAYAGNYPCITLEGLSKNYMLPGYRCSWMSVSGDTGYIKGWLEGMLTLSGMRLCGNVLPQFAIQAALENPMPAIPLCAPGGRLFEQRQACLNFIERTEGLSCIAPGGGFYMFPQINLSLFGFESDTEFARELLKNTKVLIVQGSGFNKQPEAGGAFFRLAFLPPLSELEPALEKIENYLNALRKSVAERQALLTV